MFTSYTIALFSHLLGVLLFVSGIVLAGGRSRSLAGARIPTEPYGFVNQSYEGALLWQCH